MRENVLNGYLINKGIVGLAGNMTLILTPEQLNLHRSINELQKITTTGRLKLSEMVQIEIMTKKQKEKLVSEIYFKDKKRKDYYKTSDGRYKSYNPQFIAKTKEDLINKLYDYYFHETLESIYKEWVHYRSDTKIVSNKTIEEDISIWKRFISKTEIATMQISEIKPKHVMKIFHKWTGDGLITRKDFNNRKSVLNGIFRYAVLNELITSNPVSSLPCNELKFKLSKNQKKSYTIEERNLLLSYLATIEPDAYVYAIMLDFYGILRIGEIKALQWTYEDGNKITICNQLVEERYVNDDLTLSHPHRKVKNPKGNPNYSIRTEYICNAGVEILKKMKKLNPYGKFLFMHKGNPLTTDTFNRRLQKYCNAVGIPYLSSHKIRFTNASILYQSGVQAIDIQPLLGHSTLSMTEHYIGQRVVENDISQMSNILT